MSRQDCEAEDLAIQDTLTMGADERLKLLASLIADKIAEDQFSHQRLLNPMAGPKND